MSLPEQNTPQTQSGKSSLSPGLIPSFETPQSHQFPQEPPPKISNQITFVLNVFTDHYAIKKKKGGGPIGQKINHLNHKDILLQSVPQTFRYFKSIKHIYYLYQLFYYIFFFFFFFFLFISKLYLTLLLENFKGVEIGSNLEEVVIQELINSFK